MEARHVATGSFRLANGVARRPRRARRVALALATAALAAGALAAPALADTTIGQTGHTAAECIGPSAWAGPTYVVPSGGGTITSFSFQSTAANAGQQVDFLVLRPTGDGNYTVVGKTGLVTLAGTGAVETFAANIAVEGGEILGFWHPVSLNACIREVAGGVIVGSVIGTANVDPSVGDSLLLTGGEGLSLNESANLVTTPPPTIADLIDSVEEINPPTKLKNSLLSKLDGAQKNLDAGDTAGACTKLASFIAAVSAQSGKKNGIATDDANDLIADAQAVRDSIGCG